LHAFFRAAGLLPAKSALIAELRVRDEDSPLRMNGSGMLVLNAPWKLDATLKPALHELADALGEEGRGGWRVEWLREPA
jgi:23S rRNA (adenine2030-N6)-methyltransferase